MARTYPVVFPRLPLFGIGAVLALALVAAAAGPRLGGHVKPAPAALLAERTLAFADRADGAVVVRENNEIVAVFEGEQGFVRGTLRSFARMRRGLDIPRTEPLRLSAWADGRITLEDTATGQRLDLEAFGHTNASTFAKLLPIEERFSVGEGSPAIAERTPRLTDRAPPVAERAR